MQRNRLARALAVVLLLACGAACASLAGIEDPSDRPPFDGGGADVVDGAPDGTDATSAIDAAGSADGGRDGSSLDVSANDTGDGCTPFASDAAVVCSSASYSNSATCPLPGSYCIAHPSSATLGCGTMPAECRCVETFTCACLQGHDNAAGCSAQGVFRCTVENDGGPALWVTCNQ